MTSPSGPPQLGGVLSSVDALGTVAGSDWTGRPVVGNDIVTRYAEDLHLLAELGVSAIRLPIDWARLQPAPGRIDDDWREWYEAFLGAATLHGIAVWATLFETTAPAWFDDEGSFADGRAAGRSWPRWVETAAELVGDRVAGWFPIVDPVSLACRWQDEPRRFEGALINVATAWRDAWRILHGGPPVATALAVRMVRPTDQTVAAAQNARLEDHLRWRMWMRALRDGNLHLPGGHVRAVPDLAGSLDMLGVTTSLDLPEAELSDDALRRWHERLGTIVRRAAEEGPDRPVSVGALEVDWPHADERRLVVETSVESLRDTARDGIPLVSVFVDPVIGTHRRSTAPLVDRDRNPTPEFTAWSALTRSASSTQDDHRNGLDAGQS